jgi:hypothetical protein
MNDKTEAMWFKIKGKTHRHIEDIERHIENISALYDLCAYVVQKKREKHIDT